MARQRPVDYAGTTGRISLEQARALGGRWVLQEKIDGAYARVHLDGRGRIERVLMRNGQPFGPELVGHMVGAFVGEPDSQLVGELEAHAERGNRIAATRGWRALHLFDAIRVGREYVARRPYGERRDALCRMRDQVAEARPGLPWVEEGARARELASGRFCEAVPTDWRLAPIVAQVAPGEAGRLWAEVERGELEGLVAVNLDAPLGARGSKRKVKPLDHLDCRIERITAGVAAVVSWRNTSFVISTRGRRNAELAVGDVVEVGCEGWHESSASPTPRNARIVRHRPDLA